MSCCAVDDPGDGGGGSGEVRESMSGNGRGIPAGIGDIPVPIPAEYPPPQWVGVCRRVHDMDPWGDLGGYT